MKEFLEAAKVQFLEAIDTVYTSDAYSKLCVKEIGLYY